MRQIRSLSGHSARVSSLSWNKSVLSSGSRDTSIINHDVRCKTQPSFHVSVVTLFFTIVDNNKIPDNLKSFLTATCIVIQDQGARTEPSHLTHNGGMPAEVVSLWGAAGQRQPGQHALYLAEWGHSACTLPLISSRCCQGQCLAKSVKTQGTCDLSVYACIHYVTAV
jgi:hypothetical protein